MPKAVNLSTKIDVIMPIAPQPLASFARDVTSQNGEDGLIEEIFRRIGTTNQWCLEVGAWDGKHFSNTYSLWHDQGWAALLIECSPALFQELTRHTTDFPKVYPRHRRVAITGKDSLEAIVRESDAPADMDFMSIDVDGNDYYLLDSLRHCRPRVVIIEFNPTIPPEVELVQEPDSRARFGASAGALASLAHTKGYGLAACTATNCLFVRREDFPRLGFEPLDIRLGFSREHLVYLMSTYNGKAFLNKAPLYFDVHKPRLKWLRHLLGLSRRDAWPETAIPVGCFKLPKAPPKSHGS